MIDHTLPHPLALTSFHLSSVMLPVPWQHFVDVLFRIEHSTFTYFEHLTSYDRFINCYHLQQSFSDQGWEEPPSTGINNFESKLACSFSKEKHQDVSFHIGPVVSSAMGFWWGLQHELSTPDKTDVFCVLF